MRMECQPRVLCLDQRMPGGIVFGAMCLVMIKEGCPRQVRDGLIGEFTLLHISGVVSLCAGLNYREFRRCVASRG